MDSTTTEISIAAAELLSRGLILKFEDGRCAFYSAVMLSELYAEAEPMDERESAW